MRIGEEWNGALILHSVLGIGWNKMKVISESQNALLMYNTLNRINES